MKTLYRVALLAAVGLPLGLQHAVAAPVNQAAIAMQNVTVAQALKLKDNSPVALKGKIIKAIGDEKYQFQDTTGRIVVDIDDELWQGRALSANSTVTLHGEVDVDYLPKKRVEIDVEHVVF